MKNLALLAKEGGSALLRGVKMVAPLVVPILVLQGKAMAQVEDLYTGDADYDPTMITCAVGSLFQLIEGSFGALVMVVAGLGAIISASMGAYRASVGMLVVAVGSFILRSLVSLFFGSNYTVCDLGN